MQNQIICTNTSFSGNYAGSGGGGALFSMQNNGSGSSFSFDSCLFENNFTMYSGGALYHTNSTSASTNVIKNCSFTANYSVQDGGAIYSNLASIDSLVNSTFRENYSNNNGGAMYNTSNTNNNRSYLKNCSFIKNTAGSEAGAIYNSNNYILTGYLCTIDSNTTILSTGGGIENVYEGKISLTYSTIKNNRGTVGGGINNIYGGEVELSFVDLIKNTAISGTGGGINNDNSIFTGTYVVFRENYSTSAGGGLCNQTHSTATLKNCDFLLNSAVYGGGIATRNNSTLNYFTGNVRGNFARIETQPTGGGGIYVANEYPSFYPWTVTNVNKATIVNVSITENFSDEGPTWDGQGGGIYTENSKLKLVNTTIAGNSSVGVGGGLANGTMLSEPDTIDIYNTIIFGNYASGSNALPSSNISQIYNNTVSPDPALQHSIRYSLIPNITGNAASSIANGNIPYTTAHPDFFKPVPDDLYYDDLAADYRMKRSSNLINRGQNDTFYHAVAEMGMSSNIYEDAVESPRFIDSVIDIGAFENIYLKPSGKIIYVDINVAPGGKCTGESWRHAVPKLSDALFGITDIRSTDPINDVDSVWVAKGVYHPKYDASTTTFVNKNSRKNSFVLLDSLNIYGGFAPDTTDLSVADEISDADPDQNITLLSGNIGDTSDNTDNAYHVVIAADIHNSSLSGFYIGYGYAKDEQLISTFVNGQNILVRSGAGMYNISTNLVGERLRFINNYAEESGGGLYNSTGSDTLRNFRFNNNVAKYGGAVSSTETIYLQSSYFTDNSAYSGGGAIYSTANAKIFSQNSSFTNNNAREGGAVYGWGGFSSSNDTFSKNTAVYGGGAFISGNSTFDNSMFSLNSADDGGAIFSANGTSELRKCYLAQNKAENAGGALNVLLGYIDIGSSTFRNNTSSIGGAVAVQKAIYFTIYNSLFLSNSAAISGGAFLAKNSSAGKFFNSRIAGNKSKTGGGIYLSKSDTTILTNLLVSGNHASTIGAGIAADTGVYFYTNLTVAGNSIADGNGSSGMYLSTGSHHLRNTLVWGNRGTVLPQVEANATTPDYDHSLVENLALTGTNLDGTQPANNPLFANNNFADSIIFEGGNYHVYPTSPIINKGLNSRFAQGQIPDLSKDTFDLDGNSRILNGNVDMGAYEFDAKITLTITDKTVTADGNPQYIDSVFLQSNSIDLPNTDTLINYFYYLNGNAISGLPVCPGVYEVIAIYDGTTYPACSDTATLTINLDNVPQSITFDSIPVKYLNIDPNFNLSATSSDSLTVKFVVTGGNTGCATVSPDGYVTMLDTGTVYITAYRDSNCLFLTPDSVTCTLVIKKLDQIITFDTALEKFILFVNGVNISPPVFQLAATASSGLDVTYQIAGGAASIITLTADGSVTLLDTGVVFIRAIQNGNELYNAAVPVICRLHIGAISAKLDSITTYNGEISFNQIDTVIYYLVPCDYILPTIEFNFYPSSNAQVLPSEQLTVDISVPGQQRFNFSLYVPQGNTSINYTLIVEKRFMFDDLVVTKWNNTFIANNKRAREDFNLYPIIRYRWFENGAVISEQSYYSAGDKSTDILNVQSEYYLIVNTQDREVRTCPYIPASPPATPASVYPNPIAAGSTITVESSIFELDPENTDISVYTLQGINVLNKKVNSKTTDIKMPLQKGLYVIHIYNASKKEQISVIVQ
jgi:predicted outer membrane repeat protein